MRRSALALVICLVFACVGYAQEAGQGGAPSQARSVNAQITHAKLIHQVLPKYPNKLKEAGVSGTVVLKAVIGKDGSVKDLEYVSGPEELADSATKAVRKWKYSPTLINGEPVDVSTTISVVFSLGQ